MLIGKRAEGRTWCTVERVGDCNVPPRHVEAGVRLGQWCHEQCFVTRPRCVLGKDNSAPPK